VFRPEQRKMVRGEVDMDVLVETLSAKLLEWGPETAAQVRERVAEIIALADRGGLDLLRSRSSVQDVLDVLDGNVHPSE
jgi:hypothetical protein